MNHAEAVAAFGPGVGLGRAKSCLRQAVYNVLQPEPTLQFSTNELAGLIYPKSEHRGEVALAIVKRIYSLLGTMKDRELAHWNVVGSPIEKHQYGKTTTIRPRIWSYTKDDDEGSIPAIDPEPERRPELEDLLLRSADFSDFQRLVRETR